MVEIETRGLVFKSWKKYAEFQTLEIKKLQQLLDSSRVSAAFKGALRDFVFDNPGYWEEESPR